MNDDFYTFEIIYIENQVKNHPNTRRILENLTKIDPSAAGKVVYVEDFTALVKELPVVYHPRRRSKKLFLGSIKGRILKECPGSHGHLCCNYHVINLYIGCPLDCSYCILQSYLNQPFIVINVDIERIFEELEQTARDHPGKVYRIGTGELGDSLVYDTITGFSRDFIDFFSDKPQFIFEFKTKTDYIQTILDYPEVPENIVVGFSVNPPEIIANEEKLAPGLSKRLDAAAKLSAAGYKIAYHFDPVINLPDFDSSYQKTVDALFARVPAEQVAWISIGTFRYTPDLKQMMEYNYPGTNLIYDEFIECADKKFRYFKPVRTSLYKKLITMLREHDRCLTIYLCMESPQVWKKTIGYLPPQEEGTNSIFSRAITGHTE